MKLDLRLAIQDQWSSGINNILFIFQNDVLNNLLVVFIIRHEPRHKKTCLRGLRPDKTQTGLCSHRS